MTIRRLNEVVCLDNYAEILLYDRYKREKARTKISLCDVDRVKHFRWGCGVDYYVYSHELNEKLHRFILGTTDSKMHVDHINHDVLDNRRENLRACTPKQNQMNKTILRSNSTGVTGVTFDRQFLKYRAYIYDGKKIDLGSFTTIEDAIKARLCAEDELFREYSYLKSLGGLKSDESRVSQ